MDIYDLYNYLSGTGVRHFEGGTDVFKTLNNTSILVLLESGPGILPFRLATFTWFSLLQRT